MCRGLEQKGEHAHATVPTQGSGWVHGELAEAPVWSQSMCAKHQQPMGALAGVLSEADPKTRIQG